MKPFRGTSIQWALPLLSQLLPEDLLARVQSTAVDPNVESPENGDSMPAYDAQKGEILKVRIAMNFPSHFTRDDVDKIRYSKCLYLDSSASHATASEPSAQKVSTSK